MDIKTAKPLIGKHVLYLSKEYTLQECVLWAEIFAGTRTYKYSVVLLDKSGHSTIRVPIEKIEEIKNPAPIQEGTHMQRMKEHLARKGIAVPQGIAETKWFQENNLPLFTSCAKCGYEKVPLLMACIDEKEVTYCPACAGL